MRQLKRLGQQPERIEFLFRLVRLRPRAPQGTFWGDHDINPSCQAVFLERPYIYG